MESACNFCKENPKPEHFIHPRGCAFRSEDGLFSSDNWNCGTMNFLRDSDAYRTRDDDQNGSLCVIAIPPNDENIRGYVVLGYYKDRGKTGSAVIVEDDVPPRPLTLRVATLIVRKLTPSGGIQR